jgi:hypothetical protein
MQDIDRVVAYPIKYPKGIADDCDDAYLRTLRDAWSGFRRPRNTVDDAS